MDYSDSDIKVAREMVKTGYALKHLEWTSLQRQRRDDRNKKLIVETLKKFGLHEWYRFKNNAFSILTDNGDFVPINFTAQRGNESMLDLFSYMFNYWVENKTQDTGHITVIVPREGMIKSLTKIGRNVSNYWIKNTISNIKHKKIVPAGLKGYIWIKDYNSQSAGYPFIIKKV